MNQSELKQYHLDTITEIVHEALDDVNIKAIEVGRKMSDHSTEIEKCPCLCHKNEPLEIQEQCQCHDLYPHSTKPQQLRYIKKLPDDYKFLNWSYSEKIKGKIIDTINQLVEVENERTK